MDGLDLYLAHWKGVMKTGNDKILSLPAASFGSAKKLPVMMSYVGMCYGHNFCTVASSCALEEMT